MNSAQCDAGFMLRGQLVVHTAWSHPRHKEGYTHHTRSCIRSSINALERRTGCMLFPLVYIPRSKSTLAVNHFSQRTEAEPSRRVYGWKSHGVNFGILLFWGQRKLATKQLEWWERRSFLTRHMTLTAFLPSQTQLSHFSVPAHFTELWMWSLIFVGFGKNCQETPKWIFKRLSDKRLKRSVPLGSWVMKYAFEFTKFLWPCNLLKYMFAYLNICFYFTPQHRKNKSSITENVLTV